MGSRAGRVVLGVALLVLAVVLFALLKSSGSNGGGEPSGSAEHGEAAGTHGRSGGHGAGSAAAPTIVIRNGNPVGGVRQLSFNRGERIRFDVDSDVSDEVHIHGYDVMRDVSAGGTVSFDFPASIEGVFEGELENRGEQILQLTVNP